MQQVIRTGFVLALLIGVAFCADVLSGTQQPLKTGAGHVFERSTKQGDTQDFEVTFSNSFSQAPKVSISIESIFQDYTLPIGWDVELIEVRESGFKYRVTRTGSQKIYQLTIRWFATVDSNILFYYYQLRASDFDNNQAKLLWPEGEEGLPFENVDATVFLLGNQWQPTTRNQNYDLLLKVDQVDQYGCNLLLQTSTGQYSKYFGEWVRFTIAVANKQNFETELSGITIKDQSDSWLNANGGTRKKLLTVPLDQAAYFPETTRFAVQGFQGFSFSSSNNIRASIGQFTFDDTRNTYQIEFTVAGKTIARSLAAGVFFYRHVPDCAVLYSECDYEGESLEVCSDQPISDVDATNWGGKSVRSVKVPFKRTLTLYDLTNYEGPKIRLHNNVECITGSWTFLN